MKAVIDASVLVAALVDSGSTGSWAEDVISEGPLAIPELALVEATNILRRMEQNKHISRPEATAAHRDLLRLDMEAYPFAPVTARVWDLRSNLTSYDAWYVALAEALQFPLVTLDLRLSRAPGPRCDVIVPPRRL